MTSLCKMAKETLANTKVPVNDDIAADEGGDLTMDGPVSWFVSICSSLASLIVVGIIYSYGIFFPLILKEFREAKATTAFVGSLAMSCTGLLGPMSAKFIDRFGCRVGMICGGLTCAVGLLASSFSPNILVLFLTYGICFGFGTSFVYIAAFQVIPLYFKRHKSVATGLASAGPGIGLLLMSPIIQALLDNFDWRKTFMILAAVNLSPCVLGFSIKRKKKPDSEITNQEKVAQNESTPRERCCSAPDLAILKNSMFMSLSVIMVIACLGLTIPTVHLAKYAEDLEVPSHLLSWLYFAMGITSAAGRILVGRLCDAGWISLMHIFQVGVLVFGINDFLLQFCTSFKLLIAYCSVYGICEGTIAIAMHCTILWSFPGDAFGWYVSFLCFSFLIGPVIGGLIADLSGSYLPAFITAGVLFFIAFLLTFLLKYVKKSERKQVEMSLEKEEEILVYQKITVL